MQKCTICGHLKKSAIEKKIAAGVTYRQVSKKYNISPASLSRHIRNHVEVKIPKGIMRYPLNVEPKNHRPMPGSSTIGIEFCRVSDLVRVDQIFDSIGTAIEKNEPIRMYGVFTGRSLKELQKIRDQRERQSQRQDMKTIRLDSSDNERLLQFDENIFV